MSIVRVTCLVLLLALLGLATSASAERSALRAKEGRSLLSQRRTGSQHGWNIAKAAKDAAKQVKDQVNKAAKAKGAAVSKKNPADADAAAADLADAQKKMAATAAAVAAAQKNAAAAAAAVMAKVPGGATPHVPCRHAQP